MADGQFFRQRDFPRYFYTLSGDIKDGHRSESHAALTKAFGIGVPPNAQRRNDSSAGDNDAGRRTEKLRSRK